MPLNVIKGSMDYCLKNKPFFLLLVVLLFILASTTSILDNDIFNFGTLIFSVIVTGYGLQVTHDVINDGTGLPKIMPKKVIVLGIKGFIITIVYTSIQYALLFLIAWGLNFPLFDLEDFFFGI